MARADRPPRRRSGAPRPAASAPADEALRIERALVAAWQRRTALPVAAQTDALRRFHGQHDGIAGLVVEQYADVLVAQLHEGRLAASEAAVRQALQALQARFGCRGVYRKFFPKDRSRRSAVPAAGDAGPWIGAAPAGDVIVREQARRFIIRPAEAYATGLFLEQRENRDDVERLAGGRRVLNTFAYTCSFAVAAGRGGAQVVFNIDASPRYLEWGRENLRLNSLSLVPQVFLRTDVLDYLARADRQGRTFDLIILDPPTFGRARRGQRVFSVRDDLGRLVTAALRVLDPDGHVLLTSNYRRLDADQLTQAIAGSAAQLGRSVVSCAAWQPPADFCHDTAYCRGVRARVR